jgi:hypothetical protein
LRLLCLGSVAGAAACESLTGTDGDGAFVEYASGTLEVIEKSHEWTPVRITYLRASVVGVNVSQDTVVVSWPSCILDLEAFADAGEQSNQPPSWRLLTRQTWPGSSPFGCGGSTTAELAPGDTLRLTAGEIPLAEILADSLPTGNYRFRVHVDGEVARGASVWAQSQEVDLGTIDLPTSQHPLSSGTYPRDGFQYRVELISPPDPLEDPTVRLTVTFLAPRTGALTRELSLRCPVRLLGFRSAAEREQIPVPTPVWRWPGRVPGCGDETMPVRLEPGASVAFEARVPRIRFAFDAATIDDYSVMAIIEVDGRPIRIAVDPN